MFNQVTRKPVYYVLALAMLLGIAVSLATLPAVTFAGQETTTVCHKPGTPAEGTLEISAAALDAHLAHGDYCGPCMEPQSDGCTAVNVLVPDIQADPGFYVMLIEDLDFYPGEVIHAYLKVKNCDVQENYIESSVVLDSNETALASNWLSLAPGETGEVSVDYTVLEGDDADKVGVKAEVPFGLGSCVTVEAVYFSCTPAP